MSRDNTTHYVSGYAGPKHPRMADGEFIGTTWHVGDASKDLEVLVWRDRIKRGDASRCVVFTVATNTSETITK